MAYLMHIAFDNTWRLNKNVHYLQYAGVRFKLIQNDPRAWSDVLLTLLPNFARMEEEQRAYAAAGEFLSALAWVLRSPIALRAVGGPGVADRLTLRQAQCRVRVFPEVPWKGHHRGGTLQRIADISTNSQKLALALFREAASANKVHLSVLMYWQILEIDGNDAVGWTNRMQVKRPPQLRITDDDVKGLGLNGRRLGEYLQEDCRHAIAHVRRTPGKRSVRFDNLEEEGRLYASREVLKALARHYIEAQLGLTGVRYLVRRGGRGFPEYVNSAGLTLAPYVGVQ